MLFMKRCKFYANSKCSLHKGWCDSTCSQPIRGQENLFADAPSVPAFSSDAEASDFQAPVPAVGRAIAA
jgi:hypothetical protein